MQTVQHDAVRSKTDKKPAKPTRRTLAEICAEHDLLQADAHGIFRVPFLVKGELRVPPRIGIEAIEGAFRELDAETGPSDGPATYVKIGNAQVLREPIIDRATSARSGKYLYSTMPSFDAEEVIETDVDALAKDLYDLPFSEVLDYAEGLAAAYAESSAFVDQVRLATLATAELPDLEHHLAFAAVPVLLSRATLGSTVDQDLSIWNLPGRKLLDEWQAIPAAEVNAGSVHHIADMAFARSADSVFSPRTVEVRAMPTRQLHITAGNAPHIPFFSAIRAIATKSAAVVKSPYGATIPGALLALLAVATNPDHPITRHLSLVYWPGGDDSIESKFFLPGAFDRIVVWGAPQAVASVKSRAVHAKVLTFDPRYGMSMLGREAFAEADLRPLATKIVADCLIANQKACIATQVLYVESEDDKELARIAQALRDALAEFDAVSPNIMRPSQRGEILRLLKGRFLDADWYANEKEGAFTSGVVVSHDEFSVMSHPMCRLIVIRPVKALEDTTRYLHQGVSTVSIWPEARRKALRTRIGARGVSNVMPLGQSGTAYAGQSHDGMRVLSELVDWKNG
jgi:hypothetical protein